MKHEYGDRTEILKSAFAAPEDFTGKRVLIFSTSGSAEGRLEFDKLEALLHGMKPYKTIKLAASETEKNKATAYRLGLDTGRQ